MFLSRIPAISVSHKTDFNLEHMVVALIILYDLTTLTGKPRAPLSASKGRFTVNAKLS